MKRFGYDQPVLLADDLWELRGRWSNAFGRRMIVMRTARGVVVHNAFELDPPELEWLRGLGEVRAVIAPNTFHCSDAGWMAERFPEADLFVPEPKLRDFRERGFRPKDVATADLGPDLESIPMRGSKMAEAALVHGPSRTLVLCDLAFNMPADAFRGPMRWLMNWNRVGVRFGPSRLTKLAFASDKKALVDSYARVLERDFDRVIVNHGTVLDAGGREALRESVREIFGTA